MANLNKIMQQLSPLVDVYFHLLIAIGIAMITAFVILLAAKLYRKYQPQAFLNITVSYLEAPLILLIFLLILTKPMLFVFTSELFRHCLRIAIIFSLAWLLINLVYIGETWIKIKYDIGKIDNIRERRIQTQVLYIKRLLIIAVLIVALGLILLSFSQVKRIGAGILATAGVFGAILIFTMQRSLVNILAGLQIAFTQPIRIDDVLFIENEWGKVEEITLTYVVIRIWDLRRLILPINYFVEKPFQNWSRTTTDLIGVVMIYTDYDINLTVLRTELIKVLKASPLWDGQVYKLQVTDTTDKVVELRILVSARNSSDLWDLRCYVREKMIELIKIHFPNSLPKNRLAILSSNKKHAGNGNN